MQRGLWVTGSNGTTGQTPPRFRDCLALPPSRYVGLSLPDSGDLDTQMLKMLRDYKTGRHHQAYKRLTMTKRDLGLDPGQRLIDQTDRLTEGTAPLLIFELLFVMTGNEVPIGEDIWRYLDTITCFHPDDAICQGAVYNLLIVLSLRKPDLAMARQLCAKADASYAQYQSDYLRGWVQLQLAFVLVSDSDLSAAVQAVDRAAAHFAHVPDSDGERAAVEIVGLWVDVERHGQLPALARLLTLRDTLFSGAIWTEAFLILAGLLVRAASDQDPAHVMRYLAELESVLRLRGMTHVLPAMQLLREDFRRKANTPPAGPRSFLGLGDDQVIMLLPDARMILTNWGPELDTVPLSLDRLRLARDLSVAHRLLVQGRFDQAAPLMLAATDMLRGQGWGWLAQREHGAIALFCQECLARRRYVSVARALRDSLLPGPDGADRPDGFTSAEYALLKRLAEPRGNKLLAREMGVTEAAVKFHLRNIYRKMGVHSRTDALTKAQASGWIGAGGHGGP